VPTFIAQLADPKSHDGFGPRAVTRVTAWHGRVKHNQTGLNSSNGNGLQSAEREVQMKKSICVFILLMAVQLFAADKSLITVKDSTVSNGVVIVTISESGKAYELQCNQSSSNCKGLKAADYWMVRLPKNHGLYDCSNVDLYQQTANVDEHDQVLGEYCINEK
jgi:hypothetical protein